MPLRSAWTATPARLVPVLADLVPPLTRIVVAGPSVFGVGLPGQ